MDEMGRYDDISYDDNEWLLGRDEAETIVERSAGDPKAALEELLAFARDREKIYKNAARNPGEGHSFESLYAMGMNSEYIADTIQSVIGRMWPEDAPPGGVTEVNP